MSHGKLRKEKVCLNCGNEVEDRFCPHCGQENIEPKQPFHYLFFHFIEDFTHYDGQFWKTMKYLLFFPGKLTKEYLAGKRQSYVAPVKLYIFISFITFLLFAFSINHETAKHELDNEKIKKTEKAKDVVTQPADSTNIIQEGEKTTNADSLSDIHTFSDNTKILNTVSIEQYDSVAAIKKGEYTFMRPFASKIFELKEQHLTNEQINEKFMESMTHTLPKALFLYLPFFAFVLWLFHNKEKWYYFDHGIFTLHYFSFLLIAILIVNYIPEMTGFWGGILNFIKWIIIIYSVLYFLIAHHTIYEMCVKSTIFKGIGIFLINFFFLLFFAVFLVVASILFMH